MAVTKSIMESFETEDGEVYIQSSQSNRIVISFDGKNQQFMQTLSIVQAKALANRINKVISETLEAQNG